MTKLSSIMKHLPLPIVGLLILLQGLFVAPHIRASGCEQITNCIGTTLNVCETNFAMFPGVTYTYQWMHRPFTGTTNLLLGETNPCLSRIIESTHDAGWYQATITASLDGESVSNTPCGTTVIVPNSFISIFDTNCVFFGSDMVLCVEVFGSPPQAVTWRKNGVLLPHQTNLCLTIDCYKPSDAGDYSVQIFGPCESSESHVYLPPPVLTCQPGSGESAHIGFGRGFVATETNFMMVAGVTYSYQWYRLDQGITNVLIGQTNHTLVLSNLTFADDGFYTTDVTASACGESITANRGGFGLSVLPPFQNPRILPNGTFELTYEYPGSNAPTFYVTASSDPTVYFNNWQYVGTATSLGGGLYRFTDTMATNYPRRFYKLR